MTKRNAADELDQDWADAADVLIEETFSDLCTIQRPTKADDGRGGSTEILVPLEPDTRCSLIVPNRLGGLRVAGDIVISSTSYAVDLPVSSSVTERDYLDVNGRRFRVTMVRRGGDWEMFTRADLEEAA